MIEEFVFRLIRSIFVGAFVAFVVIAYTLFKDFMNKRLNAHVVDELTADPAFKVVKLSQARNFLNEYIIKDKKDLKVTLITEKKIVDKNKHKIKLLIDTNTHSQYFNDKEFFDISLSIIGNDLCSKYEEYLQEYSIFAYVKNLAFSKKIVLNKNKCDNFDKKLLNNINKDFDVTILFTLPDDEFLLKTSKEIRLTDDYIPKTIFKGVKQIYKNGNYTVLKDFDDRVFVFKGKKLLTLINLDMREKDIKSGFFIKDDALYYTDSHLHKLNLKTLQNKIARYSIPISYSITPHQNKLWVMGDKKENQCYPSAKDLSYLLIYDYNLNLEKIYGSAASLKQSYFEGGYLYVPTYDYEKDFLFDEDLKLVRVQKHKARKSKKERIDIDSFSLYYAPSKKLVVYGDSFAFKINTPDGAEVKVYNNFKPVKYMISKDKKNDYDKFKEYLKNQYLIRSVLFEENKNKNSSFDEYDTIKLNQNRLSLTTKDYNKTFIINKKEPYSYFDKKDDITPILAVTDDYFVYSMNNTIYKIDKKSFKTIKLTISKYDKIYGIKKYKNNELLVLTTGRIFLIDLQRNTIIKKLNLKEK